MFQFIGSLLALVAILSALAGAPAAGTFFAFCTFLWVVFAKPNRRTRPVTDDAPWGAIYEARLSR